MIRPVVKADPEALANDRLASDERGWERRSSRLVNFGWISLFSLFFSIPALTEESLSGT